MPKRFLGIDRKKLTASAALPEQLRTLILFAPTQQATKHRLQQLDTKPSQLLDCDQHNNI